MIRASLALCLALIAGPTACQVQQSFADPEPGLERMLEQPRVDPFEGSAFYANGMGMRAPPRGTVPRERPSGTPTVLFGVETGVYASRVPIRITRADIEQGRERFDVLCGACHGVVGDGQSVVARNMDLRKPPSLHEARIRALTAGRLYQVIRSGYGLMPSYAARLSVTESWEVVAYVQALQLSRNARVASLPEELRQQLEKGTQ
jgi:mono/diheme cytochrome c family protein